MNYIGIDCSLTSTAICIEKDGIDYFYNYNNKSQNKWAKIISPVCKYTNTYYSEHSNYSDIEFYKLKDYNNVANNIMVDIKDDLKNATVAMEGYSYGSSAGPLIDLVTLGTLIRLNIHKSDITKFNILSPMSVKTNTCRMTYNIQDKKGVWRNLDGIAGGSFTKHQMLESFIYYNENKVNKSSLFKYLNAHADELLALNKIPKPIEDIIDAYWLKEIIKTNFLNEN